MSGRLFAQIVGLLIIAGAIAYGVVRFVDYQHGQDARRALQSAGLLPPDIESTSQTNLAANGVDLDAENIEAEASNTADAMRASGEKESKAIEQMLASQRRR